MDPKKEKLADKKLESVNGGRAPEGYWQCPNCHRVNKTSIADGCPSCGYKTVNQPKKRCKSVPIIKTGIPMTEKRLDEKDLKKTCGGYDTPVQISRKCSNCGFVNKIGVTRCAICGNKLEMGRKK